MRVTVAWVQTLELVMPVQRFAVQIRRRKAERVIHLDWNPLARRLETPPCEFSGAAERPRLVCDDAIHLVTPAGLAPCASCGKPFCRACHRERCPKCRPCRAALQPNRSWPSLGTPPWSRALIEPELRLRAVGAGDKVATGASSGPAKPRCSTAGQADAGGPSS